MSSLKNFIVGHKKLSAAILNLLILAVSAGLKALHVDVPEDEVGKAVLTISAYIFGQGIADMGKEAKKVEVEAIASGKIPTPTTLPLKP